MDAAVSVFVYWTALSLFEVTYLGSLVSTSNSSSCKSDKTQRSFRSLKEAGSFVSGGQIGLVN